MEKGAFWVRCSDEANKERVYAFPKRNGEPGYFTPSEHCIGCGYSFEFAGRNGTVITVCRADSYTKVLRHFHDSVLVFPHILPETSPEAGQKYKERAERLEKIRRELAEQNASVLLARDGPVSIDDIIAELEAIKDV